MGTTYTGNVGTGLPGNFFIGGGTATATLDASTNAQGVMTINVAATARHQGPGYTSIRCGEFNVYPIVGNALVLRVERPVMVSSTFSKTLQVGNGPIGSVPSSGPGSTALFYARGLGVPSFLTPGDYEFSFLARATPPSTNYTDVYTVTMNLETTLTPVEFTFHDDLDYDADAKPDFFLHNRVTGSLLIHSGRDGAGVNGFETLGEGATSFIPAASGDFDGDGRVDLLWHNTTTNNLWIWYTRGPGNQVAVAQVPTYYPYPIRIVGTGDFNNDGSLDIMLARTDRVLHFYDVYFAWFYQHDATTNQPRYVGWGTYGVYADYSDIVMTANIDGDNITDCILRRSWSDTQYEYFFVPGRFVPGLRNTTSQNTDMIYEADRSAARWLGLAPKTATLVATGDYNNDGQRDLLFDLGQPDLSLAAWYLTPTTDGSVAYQGWGSVDLGLTGSDWRVRN